MYQVYHDVDYTTPSNIEIVITTKLTTDKKQNYNYTFDKYY